MRFCKETSVEANAIGTVQKNTSKNTCPSTKGDVMPSCQPFMKEGVPLAKYYLLISPAVISDHLSKTLIEKFSELNP